eukprot:scaffold36409_cov36-Phaeocystis_antarctica.AAC.1
MSTILPPGPRPPRPPSGGVRRTVATLSRGAATLWCAVILSLLHGARGQDNPSSPASGGCQCSSPETGCVSGTADVSDGRCGCSARWGYDPFCCEWLGPNLSNTCGTCRSTALYRSDQLTE